MKLRQAFAVSHISVHCFSSHIETGQCSALLLTFVWMWLGVLLQSLQLLQPSYASKAR